MIVCVCRRVSDRDIQRQAQAGCSNFDELQMETGVATCCGRCTDCARDVFGRAQAHGHIAMIHGHPTAQTETQAAKP
jgi:bacterioferritin-associated ferredoxin